MKNAILQFEKATATDSSYAVAHAGLAVALDLADHFRVVPGRQAFPKAKAAAITALKLNDYFLKPMMLWPLPHAHWTGTGTGLSRFTSGLSS